MPSRYDPPQNNNKLHLVNQGLAKDYGRVQPGVKGPIVINNQPCRWTEAMYGLMPQSAGPRDYERAYNARYEIAHLNEPYASPWINKQLCVVPMQAFYAPSHASGSLVLHRISRSDNSWFGVAGLWEVRSGRAGDMFSFAVLSVDATDHPFMGGFYKDDEEKRMPAVLSDQQMLSFLEAKTDSDIKKLIGSFDSEGWLSMPLEQAWRKA